MLVISFLAHLFSKNHTIHISEIKYALSGQLLECANIVEFLGKILK